jgi:DNA-directed RNA polymerase alpha subunit
MMSYLSRPVSDIEMSARVARRLDQLGIITVGELAQLTAAELLDQPNFGRRSLKQVEDFLQAMGLRLRPSRWQPQPVDERNSPA